MVDNRRCPFCLREFQSIEEVTRHLVFANCQLRERDVPLQDGREPDVAVISGNEVEQGQGDEHPEL